MRKNSIKNNRINNEVKKELSRIIEMELHDPRIKPMTSVMSVEVAPDLKVASVYVSVLGSDEDKQETLAGLDSAKSFIRSLIAKNINLRNTPELSFFLDESIEYGINMSKLIDKVKKQDNEEIDKN